ncbi:MAG: adenylate/guanylate cyclase domain-containing protein, partial [Acidimicrobiia bacterium]
GEGIYGIDLDGNCTFANPACVRILGFNTADELLGRNMHDLVHHTRPSGEPYPMTECQIYTAFREGRGVHVDSEVMFKNDGTRFSAEYWSYPMDQNGDIIGSVLTFVDITDRRRLERQLRAEHDRAERLLLNVLPEKVAEQLKSQPGKTIAEEFTQITALFADVVGFTPMSAHLTPVEAVELLNEMFTAFDRIAARYDLERVKTMGDGYMIVAGAPTPREDHCDAIARMALDMVAWIDGREATDGIKLQVRVGINSGAAVGAVVGTTKFAYDMWGDTINVASRMESTGVPGRIQVAPATHEQLQDTFVLERRGLVEIKGRGEIETWFLTGPK